MQETHELVKYLIEENLSAINRETKEDYAKQLFNLSRGCDADVFYQLKERTGIRIVENLWCLDVAIYIVELEELVRKLKIGGK